MTKPILDDTLWPTVRMGTIGDRTTLVVDLRDLHAKLETKSRYATWADRRLLECGLVAGRDFDPDPILGKTIGKNGRPARVELVTLRAAKKIAMLERNARGNAIRDYFVNCEERLHTVAPNEAADASARLQDAIRDLPHADPQVVLDRPDVGQQTLTDVLAQARGILGILEKAMTLIADNRSKPPAADRAGLNHKGQRGDVEQPSSSTHSNQPAYARPPRNPPPKAPQARPAPEPSIRPLLLQRPPAEPPEAANDTESTPESRPENMNQNKPDTANPTKPKRVPPPGGGRRKNPPTVSAWEWFYRRTQKSMADRAAAEEAAREPTPQLRCMDKVEETFARLDKEIRKKKN